jgi:hypothetical protein
VVTSDETQLDRHRGSPDGGAGRRECLNFGRQWQQHWLKTDAILGRALTITAQGDNIRFKNAV